MGKHGDLRYVLLHSDVAILCFEVHFLCKLRCYLNMVFGQLGFDFYANSIRIAGLC